MSQSAAGENLLSKLPQCESVRGLAIVLVFCFHYIGSLRGYLAYSELPPGMGLFVGGNTGVTLFFVLSGFLLTRPFFVGAPLHIWDFLLRRALRILPMFYVAILIGAFVSHQWGNVLKSMFFYGIGMGTLPPMGVVWWSLVVEVQFYLLLPLLVWLATRSRFRWLLAPILAGGLYTYMHARSSQVTDIMVIDWRNNILGRWPVFLIGTGLAWLQAVVGKKRLVPERWQSVCGLAALILALVVLVIICDHRVRTFGVSSHQLWFDHYMLEAWGWALFLFVLLNFNFPGYRLFVNALLHRLGMWSYSIYLLHSGVLFFGLLHKPAWLSGGLVQIMFYGLLLFLISTGMSAVTYWCIERPFLSIKTLRFIQNRSPSAQ